MKHDYFVVQNPPSPKQLFLLFHGVGDNPVSMGRIGRYFAEAFPMAQVISIGGPEAIGLGEGRQWFSVQGVTEENRVRRVNAIMPRFVETVRYWQETTGIDYSHTALIGFSQGSIMILEALKAEKNLAGRAVAFSGRFAGATAARCRRSPDSWRGGPGDYGGSRSSGCAESACPGIGFHVGSGAATGACH